jgi:hypothetical protein
MHDYKPGEVLYQHIHYREGAKPRGPYTVLDPVRTSTGKLRLRGPRGGYMTTWWRPDVDHKTLYTIERRSSPHP